MKKVLIVLISLLLITGCNEKTSAQKFRDEYTSVPENNVFVYKNIDQIINILEKGTGIVYLGFKECPWCQAYVPMLDEVAKEKKLNEVYYYDILDSRKNLTPKYKKIVSILDEYLQYDDEGNKRVYVPTVVAVKSGKIVGFDDETAWDTKGFENPSDYWTEEETKELKQNLENMINQVLETTCTDCNK